MPEGTIVTPITNPIVKVTNDNGTYKVQLVVSAEDSSNLMVISGDRAENRLPDYDLQYRDLLNLIVLLTPLKYDVSVEAGNPATVAYESFPIGYL